jgi:hypothetical protein
MSLRRRRVACVLVLVAALVPRAGGQANPAALADSELAYAENAGLAGRVREGRLIGRTEGVDVEYRPANAHPAAPPRTGKAVLERYAQLWREAERMDVWSVSSPPASRRPNQVRHELTLRWAERMHVLRWDDDAARDARIRDAAQLGRRILELARNSTGR